MTSSLDPGNGRRNALSSVVYCQIRTPPSRSSDWLPEEVLDSIGVGCSSVMEMFRQRSAIDLVRTHALPANSRFSVDTFTFSPSLMKRGTRISRPVSSRAVLVPPPDDSPRTAGSV